MLVRRRDLAILNLETTLFISIITAIQFYQIDPIMLCFEIKTW